MSTYTANTYLCPEAHRISYGNWQRNGAVVAGAPLSWDPAGVLNLTRTITIDTAGIFTDCQLGKKSQLALVVSWHCPSTDLREKAAQVVVSYSPEKYATTLAVSITGTDISESICLHTQLFLVKPEAIESPVAPRTPGIILWSDTAVLPLESLFALFPVRVIKFSAAALLPGAAWLLECDPREMHKDFKHNVELLINQEAPKTYSAVTAQNPDPEQIAISGALVFDAIKTFIATALSNADFLSQEEKYPVGSIGAVAEIAMKTIFPGMRFKEVEAIMKTRSSYFSALVQCALGYPEKL